MRKRLVGWLILLPLALILVVFALANRQPVTIQFDPLSPQSPLVPGLTLPLYAVLYAMLLIGILLGGVATWFTQGKNRKAKRAFKREADKLNRQVEAMRQPAPQPAGKGLAPTDDLLELE